MRLVKWLVIALVLCGVALLIAIVFAPLPIPVEAATVKRGLFVQTVLSEGKTHLRDRYVVTAPLAGILARTNLRAGDTVDPSTVLAVISPSFAPLDDPRTRRLLTERLGAAEAGRRRADASVAAARARLDQARLDLERTLTLTAKGIAPISRKERDELAKTLAERQLQVAEFDAHTAEHELDLARAALEAAGKGERTAGRIEIRSPISGVVLKVAQESEGPIALGAPIMELGDPSQLEIIADVLTNEAVQISPGASATIERWGGPASLEARVTKIEPEAFTKVSALGIDEQRVNVVMDITAPYGEWKRLGDAFRVEARIEIARIPNAVIVPVAALFRTGSEWSVFVVENGRARLRRVTISRRNETEAAATSGLAPGERVIDFPPPALRDGARVSAREPPR
jgi:HlyD family secretion protein